MPAKHGFEIWAEGSIPSPGAMVDEAESVDEAQPTVSASKKRTVNLGDYNSAMTQVSMDAIPVEDYDSMEDVEKKIDEVLEMLNKKVHKDLEKEVSN